MGHCWKQKAKGWLWQQVGKVCGKSSEYAKQMDSVNYYNFHKNGVANSCALFCDCSVLNSCTDPSFDEDPDGAKWTALSAMYEPQTPGTNEGAGCVQKVNYFKKADAWYENTQDFCEMDEIFLWKPEYVSDENPYGVYHTGMIVDWGYIEELGKDGFTTIEGNTDGGYVAYKYYAYDDSRILGAGRPNWDGWEPDEEPDHNDEPQPEPSPEPKPEPQKAVVELDILERYDTGSQVNTLKALLKEFEYGGSELVLDGDFDWATEEAVKNFQESHDLPVTGIVDQETWRLLLL